MLGLKAWVGKLARVAVGAMACVLIAGSWLSAQQEAAPPPAGVDAGVVAGSQRWVAEAWSAFVDVWQYQLAAVDNSPISVGQVLLGLLLLLVGYISARSLSWYLGQHLLPQLGMPENAASALQTVSHYVLVTLFSFAALHMVNVPLGVFSFLGGAVAIGVGFGSQNIMNNFISGLILLAERPVRVGDVIQIDNVSGVVEQIGARSTRVRTENNLEIIVPNSTLLQTNVINWTLSDDRVRSTVRVGVAYGSPARDVSRLLEQAAREQTPVVASPPPAAMFVDFGDNALMFDLNFWLHLSTPGVRRSVESEIRHRIYELLQQAKIEIAFPQRDVHLNLSEPVEIRMMHEALAPETPAPRRAA